MSRYVDLKPRKCHLSISEHADEKQKKINHNQRYKQNIFPSPVCQKNIAYLFQSRIKV